MSSEKFCLKWNDFEANISGAFKELREDKDFFDVTLACDEDQINAHKVILSACSPFFRNILRRNPHQHPLLYMKGVSFSNLQSVLNFMYHGEVNVAQDDLNNFLAVAEDLRIKGLTQNTQGSSSSSSRQVKSQPEPLKPRTQERETKKPVISRPTPTTEDDDIQEVVSVKSEPAQSHQEYQDPTGQSGQLQQYEAELQYEEGYEDYGQYAAEVVMDEAQGHDASKGTLSLYDYIVPSQNGSKPFKCSICEKESNDKGNLRKHVENIHFPGTFSYTCKYCNETLSTRNLLNVHISKFHRDAFNNRQNLL